MRRPPEDAATVDDGGRRATRSGLVVHQPAHVVAQVSTAQRATVLDRAQLAVDVAPAATDLPVQPSPERVQVVDEPLASGAAVASAHETALRVETQAPLP